MRGERNALANVMVKGLVVSIKEKGSMERRNVVESSVDVIDAEQQNKPAQAAERVQVDGYIPKGVVPSTMPHILSSEPARIEQDDISGVRGGKQCVRDGSLTQAELIALHLRSYRNIFEYELSDAQQLCRRLLRYFASISVELVDILCCPDRENSKLASP